MPYRFPSSRVIHHIIPFLPLCACFSSLLPALRTTCLSPLQYVVKIEAHIFSDAMQKVITHRCPHCQSLDLVKNGHNAKGKQQYRCNSCGKSGVLNPSVAYTEEEKAEILAFYHEGRSMRSVEYLVGVARQTLAAWLKKAAQNPTVQDTLVPAQPEDKLEVDEV